MLLRAMGVGVAIFGAVCFGIYTSWRYSQEEGQQHPPLATGMAFGLFAFLVILILAETIVNWLSGM